MKTNTNVGEIEKEKNGLIRETGKDGDEVKDNETGVTGRESHCLRDRPHVRTKRAVKRSHGYLSRTLLFARRTPLILHPGFSAVLLARTTLLFLQLIKSKLERSKKLIIN